MEVVLFHKWLFPRIAVRRLHVKILLYHFISRRGPALCLIHLTIAFVLRSELKVQRFETYREVSDFEYLHEHSFES